MTDAPEVTVLVTAHDAAEDIGRCLDSIRAQRTRRRVEIVLVDDRSEDGTAARAGEGVSVVRLEGVGTEGMPRRDVTARQAALDAGLARARGTWILFTDADTEVPADWIEGLLGNGAEGAGSVPVAAFGPVAYAGGGPIVPLLSVDAAAYLAVCRVFSGLGQPAGALLASAAVRRCDLERLGGFRALGFSLTEDRHLVGALQRSGVKLVFRSTPPVRTRPPRDAAAFLERGKRVTSGGGTPALTATILAALVSLPLAALSPPLLLARYALGVLFALGAAAAARVLRPSTALAALVYEPFALASAVAIAVARVLRPTVRWGGLEYDPSTGAAIRPDEHPKRTVEVLGPEESARYSPLAGEVVVRGLGHDRRFFVARLTPAAVTDVTFQIEWFGPISAHCQLRFRLAPDRPALLYPMDGGDEPAARAGDPIRVSDLVFSAEAATPNDRSFDIWRGQLGLYPIAYRLVSMEEKARSMVVEQGHEVTQIPVRLTRAQAVRAFELSLERARAGRGRRFSSFSRNCGTELFHVLDAAAEIRGAVRFLRHFPSLGHRYLRLRGLVGPGEAPPLGCDTVRPPRSHTGQPRQSSGLAARGTAPPAPRRAEPLGERHEPPAPQNAWLG